LNWQKEIASWMHFDDVEVISGNKTYPLKSEITIINYDILHAWEKELINLNAQVLITDECHFYKQDGIKRTRAIKKIAKNIPHKIAMSGTPILSRPIEIYNAVKLVSPNLFPSLAYFQRRYCNSHFNGFVVDSSGHSNLQELNQILTNSIMLRRLKKDVLPELPDKQFSFVPMELKNKKEYENAEKDFISWVKKEKGSIAALRISSAESLAKTEGLKQLAVNGKMDSIIQWIKDFFDSSDEKLVVFAFHRFVIDMLMEAFPEISIKMDGSVSSAIKKEKAKVKFQEDPTIRLFVGQTRAAAEGITLTAASNVAFIEFPWTAGAVKQCEDRVHRITQEKTVFVHFLMANHTIEERIAKLIDTKRKISDNLLDGQELEDTSILSDLLQEFLNA
jgi:SNF2 family DNA or RNA helicase